METWATREVDNHLETKFNGEETPNPYWTLLSNISSPDGIFSLFVQSHDCIDCRIPVDALNTGVSWAYSHKNFDSPDP